MAGSGAGVRYRAARGDAGGGDPLFLPRLDADYRAGAWDAIRGRFGAAEESRVAMAAGAGDAAGGDRGAAVPEKDRRRGARESVRDRRDGDPDWRGDVVGGERGPQA